MNEIYVKIRGYDYFYRLELSSPVMSRRGNLYRTITSKAEISRRQFYAASPKLRLTLTAIPEHGRFQQSVFPDLF